MAYHAGLPAAQREEVHERFLEGAPCVVAATTAFGMGIDAPHVRFVFHADAPESLDSYYQELGRAGRDGAPAEAVIFHARRGGGDQALPGGHGRARPGDGPQGGHHVGGEPPIGTRQEAVDGAGRRRWVVLGRLQATGAVEIGPDGSARWTGELSVEEAAERAVAAQDRDREADRTRAQMMAAYIETEACRWRTILSYLGEPVGHDCRHCDNCQAGRARLSCPPDVPFPLDAVVTHEAWGSGRVIGYEDDTMIVLFDDGGYRRLSIPLVREHNLLR